MSTTTTQLTITHGAAHGTLTANVGYRFHKAIKGDPVDLDEPAIVDLEYVEIEFRNRRGTSSAHVLRVLPEDVVDSIEREIVEMEESK